MIGRLVADAHFLPEVAVRAPYLDLFPVAVVAVIENWLVVTATIVTAGL